MKILKPSFPRPDYVQSAQQKKTTFAFVNKLPDDVYQMVHHPVLCRDYLGDCVWGERNQKPISCYNFTFDPTTMCLDQDKTRLFVKANPKNILANLEILHEIETQNGFELSEILPSSEDCEYVIESDSKWMHSVFTISLFSFIVKCLSYKERFTEYSIPWYQYFIGNIESNETSYINTFNRYCLDFGKLLEIIGKITEIQTTATGWPKEVDPLEIHGNSGFVSSARVAYYLISNITSINTIFKFVVDQICDVDTLKQRYVRPR